MLLRRNRHNHHHHPPPNLQYYSTGLGRHHKHYQSSQERLAHPSNKWSRVRLLLLLLLALYGVVTDLRQVLPCCSAEMYESEGPLFVLEPSRLNYFTNIQGLLLHCTARGSPSPRIHWINQKDGQPVELVPNVREVYPNGTLYFPPFAVSYYRPDIHDQTYVCIAVNSVGKIRSRDIHVRAVINQQFDVRVESAYTSEGNDALLRCVVPDPVKDFVSVTSWVKDSSLNIFPPHSGGGGRYFMAPSGELLIEGVSRNDSSSSFRCRTVNRLTDETQLSENSARLQLKTGPLSNSPPRILSRTNRVRLKEGDVGVVFCLSEGHPPPKQSWLKMLSYGGLEPLRSSERVRIRQSAIIFENVIAQDQATYMCVANNTSGSDRHRIDVVVTKPLEVQVVPSVLTVDIGKSAELTCWTNRAFDLSSTPPSTSPHHQPSAITITWRKDGTEIRPSLRMSFSPSGDKLRIVTVQREDKGIYQCFVKSESDMAQAAAELRLGDSHPQMVYRFISQTLREGPAVSLKCSAQGNPTPQISWLLDGFPLPHTDRLLIGQYVTLNGDVVSHVNITSTRVEDGGEFSCLAANKLGSTSHSARLNIYGAPFVRNMPSTVTAIAGKSFHIKCPVAGYPISSITWEKDEQLLPSTIRQNVSPNGTLTIRDVDRAVDSGWYTCTAKNKNGNSNRRGVHINVVVPPKLVPFSFPEVAKEGERIFVTCVVSDGDAPIRLQWLKDSVPIHGPKNSSRPSSHSDASMSTHRIGDFDALALQIPHVTWNDTGSYSCVAHNSAGHASLTQQLVVHVPPRIAPYTFPSPVSQSSRVQVVCSVEQGDIEETNLSVVWLKDGVQITGNTPIAQHHQTLSPPPSSQQQQQQPPSNAKVMQVDAYSSILIIERVDSERDSGNYTCKISNSVEEVTKTNELVVRVPPKWVDEPKDNEVVEGKSLTISCQARGFPSPKISWKRAASDRPENFRDIPMISSNSLSMGSSKIPGYQQHQQMTMVDGMMMMMSTNAGGGNGGTGPGPSSISSLVDPVSYSNGTLFIHGSRKTHHGFYLCEASNGIGSGLSKVIRVVVNVPMRIKEPQQNVSSPVGANAVLRCEFEGDPPLLAVGWKKGTEEIKPDLANSRYRVRVLNNSGSGSVGTTVSELTVNNVAREDTARFVCYAANRHGESQRAIWLYVQEPPDIPRNLHVIAKGSRYVRLGWILTQNGNSPLKQFIIQYKPSEVPGDFEQVQVSGTVFSESIRNLRPATSYVFTVTAENEVGQSEASEGFEVKTDGEAPEGKARNVRVQAVSSSDVQVTWENPDRNLVHGQLLGFYIGFRRFREGEQYQFSTVERKEQALQEFLISGLVPFTSYEIIVQAYNGIGTGPMSEAMIVTTHEDVPNGYPEGIQCTALTSDNLQLSWNPVSAENARGLIKGYRVILEQVDTDSLDADAAQDDTPLVKTTGTTNLICTGLAKFTNYSVQVQAFTTVGSGPASLPIYCQTEEDLPNSPAAIKAVVSSSSSIMLSWLPPSEPNGIILKYNLYISGSQDGSRRDRENVGARKRAVGADTHKFQFEGLRLDEKYEFRVSASTRVGEGKYILTQKVQTKSVVNSIISLGQDLKIVWKTDVRLVCETVGNTITHQWTKFTELVRENERISMGRDGSLMIREAKRDDSGNYTCTINQNGKVEDSIVYKLTVQVPPSAPLMTAAGTSFSTINLQWKLSDTGGAPIKGYVLHVKASDEWIERRLSRHLSSYELQGLDCGTYYQIYLTCFNSAGMSMASELANVSTLGSAPSLKLNSPEFMLVQSNKSVTRLLLKDVWTGNGCKIKGFRVLYKPMAKENSRWQAVGGGELDGESQNVDLVGLKPSTLYHIRVIATNTAGSTETDLTINTPSASSGSASNTNGGDESSQNAMNQLKATPFYLDIKLMGPIFLSLIVLLVVSVSACICYKRKSPADGQSNENLSGTPSSSLYFKHNHQQLLHQQPLPQPPLRSSQQMYMTVKKSTPMKGVDMSDMDTIPQYADDIYPYATFEVNEPQRDSRALSGAVPTLDRKHPSRRTSSGSGPPMQDLSMSHHHPPPHHQMAHPLPTHHRQQQHHPRNVRDEESDEYDSYGSDSDFPEEGLQQGQQQQQQQGGNKSRLISSNMGKSTASGLRKQHQKFQDYDSHARCGNRYEFVPPAHNQPNNPNPVKYQFHHERNPSNDEEMMHAGMITSEPYAFNDSYPTALVQDKRGTNKRKSGRRKFHVNNMEPYSELLPTKYTLDPPEGFSDKLMKGNEESGDVNNGGGLKGQGKMQKVKNSNEYAIAV